MQPKHKALLQNVTFIWSGIETFRRLSLKVSINLIQIKEGFKLKKKAFHANKLLVEKNRQVQTGSILMIVSKKI